MKQHTASMATPDFKNIFELLSVEIMQQATVLPEKQLVSVIGKKNKEETQENETVGMFDSKRRKGRNDVVQSEKLCIYLKCQF